MKQLFNNDFPRYRTSGNRTIFPNTSGKIYFDLLPALTLNNCILLYFIVTFKYFTVIMSLQVCRYVSIITVT